MGGGDCRAVPYMGQSCWSMGNPLGRGVGHIISNVVHKRFTRENDIYSPPPPLWLWCGGVVVIYYF